MQRRRRRAPRRHPRRHRYPSRSARGRRHPGPHPRRLGQPLELCPDGAKPSLGRCMLSGHRLAPGQPARVHAAPPSTSPSSSSIGSTLPELRREVLNPWLEKWYNADGPGAADLRAVPLSLRPARRSSFPQPAASLEVDLSKVKPETKEAVAEIPRRQAAPAADRRGDRQPETTLDQLGLDSLDRMELTLTVEQRFGFSGDQVPATLGQIVGAGAGPGRKREPPKPPPAGVVPADVQRRRRPRSRATPSPRRSSTAPWRTRATWRPPTTWPAC